MVITEPTTMLTDDAIALSAVLLAGLLMQKSQLRQQISIRFWATALICVGIAALSGGTYHGLRLYLTFSQQILLWQSLLYALGCASFLMLVATIISTIPRSYQPWGLGLAILKFVGYVSWATHHPDFTSAVVDYLSGMAIVLLLQIGTVRQQPQSSGWIMAGIFVSFAAALVQQSGFILTPNFNHNDLYHLIELVALYFFYRGARLLKDQ